MGHCVLSDAEDAECTIEAATIHFCCVGMPTPPCFEFLCLHHNSAGGPNLTPLALLHSSQPRTHQPSNLPSQTSPPNLPSEQNFPPAMPQSTGPSSNYPQTSNGQHLSIAHANSPQTVDTMPGINQAGGYLTTTSCGQSVDGHQTRISDGGYFQDLSKHPHPHTHAATAYAQDLVVDGPQHHRSNGEHSKLAWDPLGQPLRSCSLCSNTDVFVAMELL